MMRSPGTSDRAPSPSGTQVLSRRDGPERTMLGKVFLGKYRTIRFLGEGSNAHVYLAQSLADPNTLVVVKRIKDHVLATPRFRQFFDNEVRTMTRFVHPYSVRLFDASLDDPLGPCLVLDFIPGVTLESVLTKYRRLPAERVARLIGPLCHALDAAHKAGIVHRDLKPANLMVLNVDTPQETVRVMDFGFAGFSTKPHIQLAELTGTGPLFACGTPAYVSPEMIRGDSVDARGDLYSLGVMMYEMLTGRLPFECKAQEDLLAAHIQDSPPRFHRIGAGDISAVVEGVVQIALLKYPNERHQSARELANQLSRGVGFDVWAESAPLNYTPPAEDDDIVQCTLADESQADALPTDRFVLSDRFQALLPERLAAAKLRGFIEDVGGVAVSSEPGLIRVRLELPSGWKDRPPAKNSKSGLMTWISSLRMPSVASGKEPIELDLMMQKIDSNHVEVLVAFRPLACYLPDDLPTWFARCEAYYGILRKYLMATM